MRCRFLSLVGFLGVALVPLTQAQMGMPPLGGMPPPGMPQQYGMHAPPPPPMSQQYGPPPPPMSQQYGPPPPPMSQQYGPPPPPMSQHYGPPPPPAMPPPGMPPPGMPPHHHPAGPPPPPGPGGLPPPVGPPPPPGATPGMGGYNHHQVQSSHCNYLVGAPSPWGTNASPFRLYTRSHSSTVRRGHPIEVSILPQYPAFKYFNFTDFAMWAMPHMMVNTAPPRVEPEKAAFMPPPAASPTPPGPSDISHLGVWQVFKKYAGGASTLKCNARTTGEDTVGSFEERMMELLKAQFPMDGRLLQFHPSARHGAAFLWYPDERTMATVYSLKFVAKVKSFGQWFRLESGHWRVHRPPPRFVRRYTGPRPRGEPTNFDGLMEQYSNMNQQLRTMETQMEQAGNGAL